jgi:hypothetical protein
MYIDDADDSSTDIQTFLRTIDDSTSTIKGHFRISNKLNADDFAIFTISSISEQTGYFVVNSGYVSGSASSFSNGEDIIITFARTGDVGDTGAKGQKGQTGDTGSTGAQGDKGQKGEIGATGSTGDKGQKGQTGDTGSTGATGDKGQKGEVGVTGDKGQKGEIGSTGSTGDKGQKGQTGNTGSTGAQGDKGQKGEVGATGSTGAQGDKGQKGQTGSTGATGDKGEKGQKGALAEGMAFTAYDNTGGQDVTSGAVLNLDTTAYNSDTGTFSLSSDVLTINATDIFQFNIEVTTGISSGSARSISKAYLQEYNGSTWTAIDGTTMFMYNRLDNGRRGSDWFSNLCPLSDFRLWLSCICRSITQAV